MPQDAFKQFKETEEWRSTTRLDTLYDTIELDSYEQSRVMVRTPGLGSFFDP